VTISIADAIRAASRARRSRFQVAPKIERTVDGHVFASKKEATRYGLLKLRESIGEIRDLTLQPKFPVEINGHKLTTYTADFEFFDEILGCLVVEDCKSSGTSKDTAFRLRKRAAELYYGIKVVEVIG
jgi:hypothetical protein